MRNTRPACVWWGGHDDKGDIQVWLGRREGGGGSVFGGGMRCFDGDPDQGYVANDVETEQVVDASGEWTGAPSKLASIVQVLDLLVWFRL